MLLLLGASPISSNDQTNEDNVPILENNNIIHNSFFDVTLAATEYTIYTPASGFSEISMTDYGNLLQSSQPMLPTKTFFIGLPPPLLPVVQHHDLGLRRKAVLVHVQAAHAGDAALAGVLPEEPAAPAVGHERAARGGATGVVRDPERVLVEVFQAFWVVRFIWGIIAPVIICRVDENLFLTD